MKTITSLTKLSNINLKKPIVTWGVFDGLHRGHQKIIRTVVSWSRKIKGTPVVLTFKNHPKKVLRKAEPLLLTSLPHRLLLLERAGIEVALVLNFTRSFSKLSAVNFFDRIIVRKLKATGLVLSKGTVFGKEKRGNINLIRQLCARSKIKLKICAPVLPAGKKRTIISSTLIRQAVNQGRLKQAARMLGRPVSLLGTVVRGSGRGRQLGFPTANLDLHHELVPPRGVYATRSRVNGHWLKSITNIGTRPTFGPGKITVETFLLNFNRKKHGRLYGRTLEV